jgi:hypothetical protein
MRLAPTRPNCFITPYPSDTRYRMAPNAFDISLDCVVTTAQALAVSDIEGGPTIL